jgi:hypothetical protein
MYPHPAQQFFKKRKMYKPIKTLPQEGREQSKFAK